MIAVVVVLAVLLLIAAASLVGLKGDIRSISRRLDAIRKSSTNSKVTTQTFDQDISALANRINEILEMQRLATSSAEKMTLELRQAITNISHDLRTPLTSALGYLQMAVSEKTPAEKKVEYLAIIQKRLESLSALLDELFEFTRIVEGEVEVFYEKVNVANLLRDVLSLYYEDFTNKNITPITNFPDEPVTVFADRNMLQRVFQNLVQNALVHGTDYFFVAVEPGARIRFENSVEDPGAIDASRLFERFYTAELSRNGKTTGLGLAICKELVERQNGTITASIEGKILTIVIEITEIPS